MMLPRTYDIDGPVHVAEFEGPPDGPAFVLVHGLGGSHLNWMSIAPALAARGHVSALDLPGFGRSPLQGRTAAIDANRSILDRFLSGVVGKPVVLIGNSMGGLISMLQAHARPESVAGLVLIDPALPRAPGISIDSVVAATFATYMVPGVGERFLARRARTLGPEQIVRQTLALCCADATRVDPAVIELQLALAQERAQMPWATPAFLQAARSLVRVLARRKRILEVARGVSAPTLMLMGRQDRLVQIGAADAIARIRPDWEYVVLDDCGHVPQLERPRETIEAIETWLDGPAARMISSARAAG